MFCSHTSNRANNMKEHVRTHDPLRPKNYSCPVCDKKFARKHDMKRHTKSHSRSNVRQPRRKAAAV
ncbi:C2H2-type zinc finger transcription factor [Phycomyces blakesleeanus NRRL 1555(-)]|uniref:C2H2-type zinc finger transcription factor n=2 Tax=Phycomyces blakesleeanus TaxID=4837 RepID=A0A163CXK0_PHYB8|nr:C2H2-type zinc finger transcription factor [Phycomyces blakesleeanus NRRL 1555(-)]OAD66330.1 C2H2-type zinc finger transcription factor [Phycomyces blakesleeanus NRRL 1555(-)]|eukprot:XP_018284370.1 C2H2-type zinc finger transcription factor [Phycomyces blakesleeanus NRRL 1555(-)]